MEPIWLQKWIAQQGKASRREAEQMIKDGRVTINGEVAQVGAKVNPEDDVLIDGKRLASEKPPLVYWMLNKPDKFLTSRANDGDKPNIYELPKLRKLSFLVSPCGRLDYMTEGLLILSNDGEFVQRTTHPKFKVPRQYQALVTGKLTREEETALRRGVELEDGKVEGVRLKYIEGKNLGKSKGSWYIITVFEGRNRLVRRLFEHFDKKVIRLIRTGFGPLSLDLDLKPGDYRQLTSDEIQSLKNVPDK